MIGEASQVPVAPLKRAPLADRSSLGDRDPSGARQLGGLVLTRHLDESIMIGAEVEVKIVGVQAGTVRIKIIAPRSIPVHRREVFESIQAGTRVVQASPAPVAPPRPGKPAGGLVLARTAQQSIMIGEDVEIAVVEVRPATVKLKVSAPKSIAVHRREVFDAIRDGQV